MAAITEFVPSPGTVIEFADIGTAFTASTGWAPFANVVDISKFPSVAYAAVEKTVLANTVERFGAGRGKPSEFEVACNYDSAAYAASLAIIKLDKRFRIKCIDGSGIGWEGFVSEVPLAADSAKNWTMSVKGQASGDTTPIAATA